MVLESELSLAVDAVLAACQLGRSVRANWAADNMVAKADRSPVTVADFGVQAVITDVLAGSFPDVPVVGEEEADVLKGEAAADLRRRVVEQVQIIRPGMDEERVLAAIHRGRFDGGAMGRHWALDPIDGTKGFLRGDQYAVALALIENGCVVLGVLGCPNLPLTRSDPNSPVGCLFAAAHGTGAWMRALDGGSQSPIHVAAVDHPTKATFCESVETAHSSQDDSAKVAAQLGVTAPPVRIDSQCKYAAIARGDSAIYLRMPTRSDYEEKIWDHAAGWSIVTEAGGRVTDIDGQPLDFSQGRTLSRNRGVVATNARFHDEVITAIADVLGS
jgi:3'(2'), 5'-bisphosphate nucleotidase